MARQSVNETLSELSRSGQLAGVLGGSGRPVKFLSVVDGKTFEKDISSRPGTPFMFLRRNIDMILPDLPGDMKYSFSYVADEIVAYKIFERRKQRALECVDDNSEDRAILGACIMCDKKRNLKLCSRCKHVAFCSKECQTRHWKGLGNNYGRGPEWAHKTSCAKIAGKSLRVDLDGVADETSIDSLGMDLTYGFILVKRVPKNN